MEHPARRATLVAALGFLALEPRAPELQLLHRWADNWRGVGDVVVGMERQGYQLHLTNIEAGNAVVEINVVDPILRKGYRFKGTAMVHRDGPVYEAGLRFYEARSGLDPRRVQAIARSSPSIAWSRRA